MSLLIGTLRTVPFFVFHRRIQAGSSWSGLRDRSSEARRPVRIA